MAPEIDGPWPFPQPQGTEDARTGGLRIRGAPSAEPTGAVEISATVAKLIHAPPGATRDPFRLE
jgi:hypothetical protein